jgi:DNA polymerase I-like protein with 3'-5' exonuclease and polymerase domains
VLDSNIAEPELEDILRFAKAETFEKARKNIFAQLDKSPVKKIYTDIELPLIPITDKMHDLGSKLMLVI